MSSISIRKPEFRLLLGYPDVILTRDDAAEPVGSAAPGSDRFGADLRRLAADVLRCGGRLTVVLPASEVWRGQVEPGGRTPRAEWRTARARAAASLGVAPEALRTVVGPRSTRGAVPAAAVRRSTLAEVRALLASVGLKPAAIVGAGAFEGFAAPPRLGGRWAPPPVGQRRALAGAGGLALAAIALMVMGLRPDTAAVAPASVAPAPAVVAVAAPVAPAPATTVAAAAAKPAEPVRIARADPPPHRPEAPFVPSGAAAQKVATLGTRNVPMVFVEDKGRPVAELRLAQLTDPRGPLTDVAVPLHRPAVKPNPPSAAALGSVPAPRPEPRPGELATKSVAPAPEAREPEAKAAEDGPRLAGERPMPRPEAEPVRVASLGDQVTDAVIAAAVLAPAARPAAEPAVRKTVAPKPAAPKLAEPPRVVAPAPKLAVVPAAKPAPQPVVEAAPRPAVQRVVRVEEPRKAPTVVRAAAKPVAQPVRVVAVPAPKAKPAAAPVRVAAAAPAPAPAPTVRRQSASAGFLGFGGRASRNDLALVGIFGGGSGRSALIQMPNGKIQKVSAGDRVQGVQIAAIGTDSVRVTDGRRESVLEMPD